MERLGVIGTGNMGSAIINGVKKGSDIEILAFDVNSERLGQLPVTSCATESEVVEKCRYVLLAVKPQVLENVLDSVASAVRSVTVFISICAGISAEFIREKLGNPDVKVVTVMPNTPMMLGFGASAMAHDEKVTDEEFAFAKKVISSCGIAVEIPMDKMKEIICVNGSSPAFIYLFAKGFLDYAASVGISADAALELFSASLIGSAKMLTESGMTVDELIKQVSSPGGTTIAGLEKLYSGDIVGDVDAACKACTARAYELGK